MTISVQVTGGRELAEGLRRVSDELATTWLKAAVQAGAMIVRNEASARAPYRTGNLRRSIHHEVIRETRGEVAVAVGTNLDYAAAVEFGSGIHATRGPRRPIIIRPRNRRALYWPGAPHPVRAVRHPGVRPRPYLIPAFKEKTQEVVREITESLRQLLRGAVR